MSDNTETDALLTLADRIDEADERPIVIHHGAAAELRRLVAENEALREVNEAFGKRQEWWNEKMVALEAINAELREALRRCRDMVAHPDNLAFIDAALAKVEARNGS